jgi:Ca-activated chloride channel family protein
VKTGRPVRGPRHTARAGLLALIGLALGAANARGQAGLLVPTSSGRPDPDVLALREMTIEAGIARAYARVDVRQVFENRTDTAQEGTYRFRLPPSAAIGDFAVWDGLVRIPGTILEKQRARALYRELTTARVDPGLLQQGEEDGGEAASTSPRPSGGATFAVTIAPIPARATKRLELQFQQEVPFVSGRAELRLGLRSPDGEPLVAGSLRVRIRVDGGQVLPVPDALPLLMRDGELVFEGQAVRLDRDLVVRLAQDTAPLRVSAFRNPDGHLPDGLALAPWERPSEIPPEKDGFFLLEATPPASGAEQKQPPPRPPVTLGIAFDTSLSVRFAALETAYARLVRVLHALSPGDRFALVPFDRQASASELRPATVEAIDAALAALRSRALGPGSDVAAALREARTRVGDGGRLLLLTDGPAAVGSRRLADARGPLPLFTVLTGEEEPEAYRAASVDVLGPGAADAEADLFLAHVLEPLETASPATTTAPETAPPFRVVGGEPRLRDIYAVLVQPPSPASLSGWIGRYAVPQPSLRWEVGHELLGVPATLEAPLPERALEARDLPRRWARARVDYLLMRIEAEGERREWIDEIVELSRRYKFVTPYTAFLAAPRALLKPRRIQPGDPVLRVECDPGTVSATALFPFGRRLALQRRPGTRLWEGRFLVPEGLADGRYAVRVLLRDRSGAHVSESKTFVLDGRAPTVVPETPRAARAGESVRIAARADEDVIFLSVRIGDGAPVPLRWDPSARRSVGTLVVPASVTGPRELLFEAVDGARNHGFARAAIEVRP